jgi:hypothetical protein
MLTLTNTAVPAKAAPSDSCDTREGPLRLGSGRQLPSLAAATRLIAFRPRTIAGHPFRVYVTREARPAQRGLTLVYRSAGGHRIALSQSAASESRAVFDAFVRDVAERDPCGSRASTVRLTDGQIALLIEADDRRVLNFRSGNVALLLLGAPGDLSRDRAIALANLILKSS